MVPRVGQRIGPYEILGRLGSGGMGIVFSAWDVRLQRDVAIKLLRDEFLTPGMRSRFLQEARAASRLNHPNICTIFDIGEQQGDPYLVMELLKGETVRTRIARSGPQPQADIQRVAAEVAEALVVAHAQGIVHRDIKPANIILVERPGGGFQSKVLDFGLAKMGAGLDSRSFDHTANGTTVGTVSYMSPEQARGELLDARSDLFSLGIVLYEMSTGQLPFQGATSALIFVQLLSHRPEPIREFNNEIPRDLERIISKLLEKGRGDRFQTARDLVVALSRVGTKRPGPKMSLWNRGRNAPAAARPESSQAALSRPPDATPAPRSSSGESILRPVKRITASERHRTSSKPGPFAADSSPALDPLPALDLSSIPVAEREASAATSSSSAQAATTPVPPPLAEGLDRSALEDQGALEAGDEDAPSRMDETGAVVASDPSGPVPAAPIASAPASGMRNWIASAAILLLLLAGWIAWRIVLHHMLPAARARTALAIGPVTNSTGDDTLGATLAAGLGFDLDQSPKLSVRGTGDLAAGLRLTGVPEGVAPSVDAARRAAKAAGAAVLVAGDIRNDNAAYVLSLRAYDTATGKWLAQASETASSREQVADAIDRLAFDLRSRLGESGDSIEKTSVPLGREATSNLDALQAYVSGDTLAVQGRDLDAIAAFERAVQLDPRFSQAYLRLADLYRGQHAAISAAKAAASAVAAASTAGDRARLLVQAGAMLDGPGDATHALDLLRQVARAYPGDIEAGRQTTLAEQREGRYADALDAAQAVLRQSPYDAAAAGEAELAMLALDRTAAAAQLEQQSARAGQPHPATAVWIAYLDSPPGSAARADVVPPGLLSAPDSFGRAEATAAVLDAQGELAAGLAAWNDIADRAHAVPELASAASYALSRAALDQALAADCPLALELAGQSAAPAAGAEAAYAAGLAAALCGGLDDARQDLAALTAGPAQTIAVRTIYIPELTAAIQWKAGDAVAALATLQSGQPSAQPSGLVSLAPYLRGLIHLSAGQALPAVADFQSVLLHRGPIALADAEAGPLAQLELARAYAAAGDTADSTAAYGKFLQQWTNADPANALVVEAQSHSR